LILNDEEGRSGLPHYFCTCVGEDRESCHSEFSLLACEREEF
jgi:hypothetical protein